MRMMASRKGRKLTRATLAADILEGTLDRETGVRSFKGIPFAAPPIGELRWKPPQPARPRKGARGAGAFGPRAMQNPLFGDMVFRARGMSEDCLYLNVWTSIPKDGLLPVLVYFYGGGFGAGDGSEPRYDGASMARQDIVTVTVNYRLGVFGFLAHPELTKESPHGASGNYGLMDQQAALVWVRDNIAAFGGDPARVTIAGESAGSISVCAQMASPLSQGLFAGAIGESGSMTKNRRALADAERSGARFAAGLGIGKAPSLAKLRRISATKLLEAAGRKDTPWFWPIVDGWFLPKPPADVFAAGEQARVPLLAGSNSAEGSWTWLLGKDKPTVGNYRAVLTKLYAEAADEVFSAYPASTEPQVMDAAQDLESDRFIAHETWKWVEAATRTGGKPTWYYLYAHPRPPGSRGASHSAEIEYALGNLDVSPVYAWTPDDYAVSRTLQEYFANFVRTGNPNGPGLPEWPEYGTGKRMTIDVATRAEPVRVRARYELLDRLQDRE